MGIEGQVGTGIKTVVKDRHIRLHLLFVFISDNKVPLRSQFVSPREKNNVLSLGVLNVFSFSESLSSLCWGPNVSVIGLGMKLEEDAWEKLIITSEALETKHCERKVFGSEMLGEGINLDAGAVLRGFMYTSGRAPQWGLLHRQVVSDKGESEGEGDRERSK